MYLFQIFRSFLPMRNPVGFGASDWLVLAVAFLMTILLVARAWLAPYAREIAKRTVPSMCFFFLLPIALRLALLPHCPIPVPSGADDFSYILLGDTLRHLRLANPPHSIHQFFEAVFVLQQPTYASIYPVGQGILLAFGRLFFQSFWAGVLLSVGAFCAVCYWMLRAWVSPAWAFVGGLLAVIQFSVLNPWLNSYWGGAVSACAGCLVFGSLPRLQQTPRKRFGLILGFGLALQILTRPFEAIFLLIAVAVFLFFAFRANFAMLAKPAWGTAAVVSIAFALTLLQNRAVTQKWLTMPYMESRYQYGVPTTFTFQSNPIPHRPLTPEQDLDYRAQAAKHGASPDTIGAYFRRLGYRFRYLRFFLLPPVYFALIPFLPTLRQPRFLWAAGSTILFAAGTNFYPYFFPQYVAAVTCLFVLFAVQGLQNLGRVGRRLQLGETASQCAVLLCGVSFLFWFGLYAFADNAILPIADYQSWNYINYGDPEGRLAIQNQLDLLKGKQLVFVRYAPFHRFREWIHNAADIDSARVVWANDLGTEENQKLLLYYPDRKPWLLEPDTHPLMLKPYESGFGGFLSAQ